MLLFSVMNVIPSIVLWPYSPSQRLLLRIQTVSTNTNGGKKDSVEASDMAM